MTWDNFFKSIFNRALYLSTTQKQDVFIEYSPHIKGICIRIFKTRWHKDALPDTTLRAYSDTNKKHRRLVYKALM